MSDALAAQSYNMCKPTGDEEPRKPEDLPIAPRTRYSFAMAPEAACQISARGQKKEMTRILELDCCTRPRSNILRGFFVDCGAEGDLTESHLQELLV